MPICSLFAGSIIRCMRRLEELLRQMCQAAKAIGNTDLENKFAEGNNVIYIGYGCTTIIWLLLSVYTCRYHENQERHCVRC